MHGRCGRVQHQRAPRQFQRQARVLLHQDDRHAALVHQRADGAAQFLHDDGGQPFHRFVQQQQGRIGHQRAGDGDHLLFAARQLVAQIAAALFEARKGPVDPRDIPGARPRHGSQVLLHRQRREHPALLRHPAQAGPRAPVRRHPGDVRAAPADAAAMQAREAHQRGQQRGLADAVAAQQREAAASVEAERHVVQHDGVAVAGGHALQRQQFSHARPPRGRPRARAGRRRSLAACLRSARGRPPAR